MARFLIATMPVPGHVAPIASVARELLQRGHSVRWYTSQVFQQKVERTGATFRPIKSTLDFGDSDYNRYFPERARLRGLRQLVFDFEHLFVGAVEGYLTDLREISREFEPDVLLIDPAVAAGWLLNELDGLPTVVLNITVLGIESRDLAPFGLGLSPNASPVGRARNKLLLWLVDHVIFRRVNVAYRTLARKHGWPILPFRPRATEWLYLQPSVEAFEYPRSDLPPQLHFIGPLLPEPDTDFRPPPWWHELDAAKRAGKRIVLVTQGTIATEVSELIEPTLAALETESLIVIAAGADRSRLASVPANARVEAFVPFVPLMPLVDVYVTNGGYGGVTIALSCGVPIVCAGTTEDKAEVNNRVGYFGVGIDLKTSKPSPEKLRTAILTVLADPSYRERAVTIQHEFERHDAPAEAAALLEQLAATRRPVLRAADAG